MLLNSQFTYSFIAVSCQLVCSILSHSICWIYNLTLVCYLWYNFPLTFLYICLSKYFCLVITTGHSEHKSDWAPGALPYWELEWMRENVYPCVSTFSCWIMLPYFYLFIFSYWSDNVTWGTNIAAPCYVSYPVIMSVRRAKLSLYFKFRWCRVFLPYFYLIVHTSCNQSFWNEINTWTILTAHVIYRFSHKKTWFCCRSPAKTSDCSIMSVHSSLWPLISFSSWYQMNSSISGSCC